MNKKHNKLYSIIKYYFLKNKYNLAALAIVTFFILIGNIIYVSGFRDPNPSLQLSGLAVEAQPRLIEGIDTLDPNNGFTSQSLGNLAADTILKGDMPYWNHYEGIGMPLAGEMQSAALSPFTLLLHFENGLLMAHMLLEIVAGFFTYLFLRRIGLGWRASLLGGVIYSLNGTFAWLTNAAFNPIAFLPMLMYGIEVTKGGLKEKWNLGWFVIALAIALSLYAGFPETAFLNSLLACVWALLRLVQTEASFRLRFFKRLLLGGLVGLLLASPILIAFLGFLPDANIGGHGDAFAHAALKPISAPAHFMPYIYGPLAAFSEYDKTGTLASHWGNIGGYIAISVVVLAFIGLFSKVNKTWKTVFLVWIVITFMKVFGFGIAELFWNLVPTVENAAFYRYITPSISFAFTVLAAFGLQGLITKQITGKAILKSSILFLVFIITNVLIAKNNIGIIATAPNYKYIAIASVLWSLAAFFIIIITYIIVKKKYIFIVISLVVLADVLIMFSIPQLSTPTVKIDEAPVEFLKDRIGNSRFYTLSPIAPNYGSYYEVASINQNDLPVSKRYSEFINNKLDTNTDPILFIGYYRKDPKGPSAYDEFTRNINNYKYLGVKYLVTMHKQLDVTDAKRNSLIKIFESKGVDIYEIPNASNYFDVSDGCDIKEVYSRDELVISCDVSSGHLVRKNLWIAGWSAANNNTETEIKIENDIVQKVDLTEGNNVIKFSYTPRYMASGYILFIVGVGIAIVYVFMKYQKVITKKSTIIKK